MRTPPGPAAVVVATTALLTTALLAACGAAPALHGQPAGASPPKAPYIAVCTSSSLTYVDPANGRAIATTGFALPDVRLFQPALRSDSVAYRASATGSGPAYDCGSWSWDGALDRLAGSSEGRLATIELRRDTITYVTPPPSGPYVTTCCDVYDPTGEGVWYVHSVDEPGGTLGYRLIGPAGPGPTSFGQQATVAFTTSGTPLIGALLSSPASAGPYGVTWQPFASTAGAAPPPPLPEAVLEYGVGPAVRLPALSVGVLRHSDDGTEVAFTASSGHDCQLWIAPTAGGAARRVGTVPYTPPDAGGAGCGAEVVRFVR